MILLRADDLMEWVDMNTYCLIDNYDGEVEVVYPGELRRHLKGLHDINFELICDAIDEDPILEEAVKAYILTGRYE